MKHRTFFTSDHHFGHAGALGFYRRPFATVAEMDRRMIDGWNAAVEPHDEVWHLGDFAVRQPPERVASLLTALRGRKHLVAGNNDDAAVTGCDRWESIQPYAEASVDGAHLVLCHYPFRTWRNMSKGWINLHGHSHGRLKPLPRQFDVGVDVWNFQPVRLADVLGGAKARAISASGMPSSRTEVPILPDVLCPGLRVVYCGTAAGSASAASGAYYAGPGNRFWRILAETGLTSRQLAPGEFRELLCFGIGLTDIGKFVSGADAELPIGSFDARGFADRIRAVGPRIVAFNGKRAARAFLGIRQTADLAYGPISPPCRDFPPVIVLPSTSGAASGSWSVEPWHALAALVRSP